METYTKHKFSKEVKVQSVIGQSGPELITVSKAQGELGRSTPLPPPSTALHRWGSCELHRVGLAHALFV